jgi:DNA (cytosine-5)-methyltransferase 1
VPRLLDLFCGAGGAAVGYHRVGFTDIVGIDMHPQANYPFEFALATALSTLQHLLNGGRIRPGLADDSPVYTLADFDAIHASPPCQRYTVGRSIHGSGDRHPDLVGPCRDLLERTGKPWVMENVPGSPLLNAVTLCGLMFGLKVIRHRLFEASFLLMAPPHRPHPKGISTGTLTSKRGGRGNGYSTGEQGLVCVAGNNFVREAGLRAMGIEWGMSRRELANAIPPAYTEFIGRQLMGAIA